MRLGPSAYAPSTLPPRMPQGLVELMEGLAREVLRRSPTDLHQFCADHMHRLLVLRAAREGRTRTLTLEEKIARAQKIVRQRAEKRRRRYDNPDQRSPGYSDEEESTHSTTRATSVALSPGMMIPATVDVDHTSVYTDENIITENKEILNTGPGTPAATALAETAENNDQTAVNISPLEDTEYVAGNNDTEKEVQEIDEDYTKSHVVVSGEHIENNVDRNDEDTEEKKTSAFEIAEKENAVEDTTKNELQEIGNGGEINDTLDKEPNIEVLLDENDAKQADGETVASEPEASLTNETSVIDGSTKVTVENGTELQECDELPVENHIYEEKHETSVGSEVQPHIFKTVENKNETDDGITLAVHKDERLINENAENISEIRGIAEVMDMSSDETKVHKPIEYVNVRNDSILSINHNNVNLIEMAQTNAAEKSNDLPNDRDLPDIKMHSENDNSIETTSLENDVTEPEKSSVVIDNHTEVDVYEEQTLNTKDNNIEANDYIQVKSDCRDPNESNDSEIKPEDRENYLTENSFRKDSVSNKNIDKDNHLKIQSVKIENEEDPKKDFFESVTIEVNAPTPLPEETDIKDNVIIRVNEPATTDNESTVTEVEKADELAVGPKIIVVEVHNDKKNDMESVDLPIKSEVPHSNALKEKELIINVHSSSNEEETDSNSDKKAEEKDPVDINIFAPNDMENMSYMTAPGHDIDINALAKSDSTNDMVIEETTESISETNTETDEREESSNNTPAMDLETAAVTIQKVFRTFLFKSRASTLDDVSNDEGSMDVGMSDDILDEREHLPKQEDEFANIKERRALGITRMDTVLQTVNEEKSMSLSTDDSSTLSSAATTIQAHVRGFLVRNRLHSNKTTSLSSLVNSNGHSSSLDAADNEQLKNKTVLNIHIVPEGGHFMSRDESMAMSLDLPLDYSPPTSLTNLHPLSYDVSERRKLLKREDAIQSISPPSTNSGKLSEESVKEISITESDLPTTQRTTDDETKTDVSSQMEQELADLTSGDTSPTKSTTMETVVDAHVVEKGETKPSSPEHGESKPSSIEPSADEMDVVTPFVEAKEKDESETPRLLHSGECHDMVLPTCVSRSETAVVREFKTVLGYFIIWNNVS